MIRLSVTDLDQYLYWLSMEDVGSEWLIDRLTIFEPSPAMAAGSAFHKLMEEIEQMESSLAVDHRSVVSDGVTYTFKFQGDAEIIAPAIRELKIEKEISPGVVLVGKIDGMDGGTVIDYKLTERLDAERYADSYQWRAYLALFEVNTFEYSVFEGSPDRGRTLDYTVYAHHRLRFYAYKGMREDVERLVQNLALFVRIHNVKAKMQ